MKKKFLVIGYGSIGQKHVKILKNLNIEYKIISNQKNIKNKIKFNEIKTFDPEYIIIASTTNRHLKDLKKIDKILKNKVILVEKPLSAKNQKFKLINNKNVFIAYNLRFNPLIKYIKKKISKNKIININIKCSSFLPKWRKRHYTLTSSAKKKLGGGVINDLSHEIDFANYFIKNLKTISIFQKKISNLKIETNDFSLMIFKKKKIVVTINLDYFSRIFQRIIDVNFEKFSLQADLIKNKIIIQNKFKKKIIKFKKVDTYKEQIYSLIKRDFKSLCTIDEGKKIMEMVSKS